ncbi:MAG TPA: histidine phosphatase family protein [Anaerolineaceae bacterium]|nr:histidine phosphatase family protein [Anaerolineaceae bacterium]
MLLATVDENYADITLAALAAFPADRPVSLLMRHSLRVPILENKDVYLAGLTTEGAEIARCFGNNVSQIRTVGRILTSPVSRCVDTALLIAQGAGWRHFVEISDCLSHAFMLPVPNLMPPGRRDDQLSVQVSALLDLLIGGHSSLASVDLFITHDTVIEALAGNLLGVELRTNGNVPNYLEALFVWVEDGEIFISWRNYLYSFPVSRVKTGNLVG